MVPSLMRHAAGSPPSTLVEETFISARTLTIEWFCVNGTEAVFVVSGSYVAAKFELHPHHSKAQISACSHEESIYEAIATLNVKLPNASVVLAFHLAVLQMLSTANVNRSVLTVLLAFAGPTGTITAAPT